MFLVRKVYLARIVLLLTLACASEAYEDAGESVEAGADTSALAGAPDSGWALALTPSRDSILVGEPVYLVVRLVNHADETRGVPDLLSPEFGFLQLSIRAPGGEGWSSYDPPLLLEGRGAKEFDVLPDSAISTVVPIFYERDGWVFDEAGTYEIRGAFWWEELQVESPPAVIQVVPPADEHQREAARRFMSAGRFVYLGGGSEADTATLAQLAESDGTPFGEYARVALAVAEEEQDGGACDRTRSLLATVLPRIADPIVAADGHRVLAGCLETVGRAEETPRALEGFRRRHGTSEVLPEALERLERP